MVGPVPGRVRPAESNRTVKVRVPGRVRVELMVMWGEREKAPASKVWAPPEKMTLPRPEMTEPV